MEIVNRQRLYLLVQLAKSDGHLADQERSLIHDVGAGFGIGHKEIDEIIKSPGQMESLGALSRAQKREYFVDCIKMVLADGRVDDRETKFCQNVAVKLGYKMDAVTYALHNVNEEGIDLSSYELPSF